MNDHVDDFNTMAMEIFDAEHGLDAIKEAARTGRPLAPVRLSMPDGSYQWRFLLLADVDAVAGIPHALAFLAAEDGGEPSHTLGTYRPLSG